MNKQQIETLIQSVVEEHIADVKDIWETELDENGTIALDTIDTYLSDDYKKYGVLDFINNSIDSTSPYEAFCVEYGVQQGIERVKRALLKQIGEQ